MAQTALFTSPMARKKTVSDRYIPNTYRVISESAEAIPCVRRTAPVAYKVTIDSNVLGQYEMPRPSSEHRHNRPNPKHVNFLRQDVKLLNEPICDVWTADTVEEQHRWWPHRSNKGVTIAPPRTLDTTVRDDFQYRGSGSQGYGRHGTNPNKTPASGCVPVNFLRKSDGKQRFWKEGLSYEHQYNSRLDPSYPPRGKRHGAFVWTKFPDIEVNKLLHEHGYISDKVAQAPTPAQSSRKNSAMSDKNAKNGQVVDPCITPVAL